MSIFPARVLLATDGSREARLAAGTAIDLARSNGCELHVVYVEPASDVYALASWETYDPGLRGRLERAAEDRAGEDRATEDRAADREARRRLEERVREMREARGEVAGAHARAGHPGAEIVGLAEEIGAGLIVMGSRGLGGIGRAFLGSVSDAVVRHARCSVLVVRQQAGQARG